MFIMGLRQLQDPYYQGFAAQISFYLLMSIVPIFLLIIQLLGLFDISTQTALSMIEEYTGRRVSGMVNSLLSFNSIGYGNIVFILIAFWAGSRASFSIARITNYIYSEGDNTGRNYFLERARAILTMFLTLISLVIAIIILCYGKIILIGILGILNIDANAYIDSVWMLLRWPLGFILYFMVIGINYYILPTYKRSWRRVIPGTAFAAFGMVIVSWAYSFYASTLVHYDIMYGALSSVIAIMIWFLLLSWVLILGVLCNKLFEDTSVPFSKRTPAEYPIGGMWRPSRFDIDPNHVHVETIVNVITGKDDVGRTNAPDVHEEQKGEEQAGDAAPQDGETDKQDSETNGQNEETNE